METPLQITFQGLEPSPALEARIHEKAAKLERFSDRITSCRVVVERPPAHKHRGGLYEVRVHVEIPGAHLDVGARAGRGSRARGHERGDPRRLRSSRAHAGLAPRATGRSRVSSVLEPVSAAVQTCTARADGYARCEPERTVLHRVVSEPWPRSRERAEDEGELPRFVIREFEEYLRCGVLEHGVVHLACSRYGHSMVVAFSWKRRGWCPSCLGRRMADLAAHLVDDVLPEVPLRQWVCSLPWTMRCMLAFDRALCTDVLDDFIAALTRSLKWRAKAASVPAERGRRARRRRDRDPAQRQRAPSDRRITLLRDDP